MKLRSKIELREGEELLAARLVLAMSQADVATEAGFHQTAVSKMEQGVIPVNPRVFRACPLVKKKELPDWVFLRIIRKRLGLEQKALSLDSGIPPHQIGEMEQGKRPVSAAYEALLLRKLT